MEQGGEETAADGNVTHTTQSAECDADQDDDAEEDDRIAALERAQHRHSKVPTEDEHKRKPLIEEL